MTPDQVKALCDAAMQRIHKFVNYSAGQHIRFMREQWSKQP